MLKKAALFSIKMYQSHIRYLFATSCRFDPSCSEYASQAIRKYGFFKGSQKALTRVLQCHPWSAKSGYDPLI